MMKKLSICIFIFFLIVLGTSCSSEEPTDVQEEEVNRPDNNSNLQSFISIPETLPEEKPADETPNAKQSAEETEAKAPIISEEPIIELPSIVNEPATEDTTNQQIPAVIVAPIITSKETSPPAQAPEAIVQPEQSPVKQESPIVEVPTNEDIKVYITETGTKYHKEGCRHLKDSKFERTLKDAISEGYGPCKTCNPPTQ